MDSTIFFVWKINGGQWNKRHSTFDAATEEAKRLAQLNPGESFYVLGALGVAMTDPYPKIFTEFEIQSKIPF